MIDVLGFQVHLELNEQDVSDLVGRGWLCRDPDPGPGVVQVRFTPKGMTDIIAIGAISVDGCTIIGFRDDADRQWVIGRVQRRPSTEAAPVLH